MPSVRVNANDVREVVSRILFESEMDSRNFVQSIDLQIKPKYRREKVQNGKVKLPHVVRYHFRVCILGDHHHCQKAKELGIAFRTMDDLACLDMNKERRKQLAQSFDAFLASASIIRKLVRLLVPIFSKLGKFPTTLHENDHIPSRVEELMRIVTFKQHKEIVLSQPIGHVEMNETHLVENVMFALYFCASLMRKGWSDFESIHLKSTMGIPQKLL
ncbi:hypothetical protein C9374_008192 [Naegleria lovaniensis]|uniref:Uncharacterized protein n=1 Tax=Naegleria lovaniensis TaxID=51637 RepID=A0AA88KI63_NAELO|nr:uncharacterized protein C9374_008192 [Naegleria lovaniensis]KAG2378553.1 hypothetical protein C9374_008192 [Naegleria lovaniensis]